MKQLTLVVSALLFAIANAADDAGSLRDAGYTALRESQTNSAAIVKAAEFFAKAEELFEKAGKEVEAREMNSYLYWCKKKMSMADIDVFLKKGSPTIAERLQAVEKKLIPATEAKAWLDRADDFARANPNEPLFISIRYFEVADRFKDSDAGRTAMSKSLTAMQQVQAPQIAVFKPAPTDGKAYVQSEPSGASIFLADDGHKLDMERRRRP